MKTGSRTVKCRHQAYNIAPLLVGSEGTLGMISRAILKLRAPAAILQAMMAVFDNVQKLPKPWPASSPPTSCPVRWNSWTT